MKNRFLGKRRKGVHFPTGSKSLWGQQFPREAPLQCELNLLINKGKASRSLGTLCFGDLGCPPPPQPADRHLPGKPGKNVALTGPHPASGWSQGSPGGLLVNRVAVRTTVLGHWLWCEMAPGGGCVPHCPCGFSRADGHFLRG